MRSVYLREYRHVARLAFSMWNREPASPSVGSFDRRYWGWKAKDFGDATLQYAVRLVLAYLAENGQTGTLPCLLEQYVCHITSLQQRDGSFDQCYPNERTPGVVYDFLSTLVDVWASPWLEHAPSRKTLEGVLAKAASYVVSADEVHGEIANHLAEYAFECFYYAQHFHDERMRAKGESYLERTLRLFDREEGWFCEYDGADAGYQTRTLRYLVKCAALLQREELWDVAERAAEFLELTLMPDGSIHPMLGCRSTALLYPSGFEALAQRSARFEPLVRRIRHAWCNELTPLPSAIDFENAIRLADDALDAAKLCPENGAAEPLPSPTSRNVIHLVRAGLLITREPHRIVYLHHSLGGTVVIQGRDTNANWCLLHEDSGYVLRERGQTFVTRIPASGTLLTAAEREVRVEAVFFRALHAELTPLQMVVLRILNFTLLCWSWSAEWFRRLVVRRLMTGRHAHPVRLKRCVQLKEEQVVITDEIVDERQAGATGHLLHCRRVVGAHMASSRYFQKQELASLPLAWTETVSWQTNKKAVAAVAIFTPTLKIKAAA